MSLTANASSQCDLHNRAFSALAIEKIRTAQIEALQSKLDALRHNLAIEASETRLCLDQFAKSDCRKFTNLFMTRLPQELRDMVYQHLNKSTAKRIDGDYFHATRDPVTKCYSFNCARWKALHYPEHFRNEEYVGEDFAREIAEHYYRKSIFVFDDSKEVVSKFLNTDEMDLGFVPKLFVSSIEVNIRAYCHDRSSFQAYIYGLVKSPEQLQAAFEGVFELRRNASLCVHFLTEAKSEKERDELFVAAMPELLENLEKARSAGYKVKFFLDRELEFKLGPNPLNDWKEQLHSLPWPSPANKS